MAQGLLQSIICCVRIIPNAEKYHWIGGEMSLHWKLPPCSPWQFPMFIHIVAWSRSWLLQLCLWFYGHVESRLDELLTGVRPTLCCAASEFGGTKDWWGAMHKWCVVINHGLDHSVHLLSMRKCSASYATSGKTLPKISKIFKQSDGIIAALKAKSKSQDWNDKTNQFSTMNGPQWCLFLV